MFRDSVEIDEQKYPIRIDEIRVRADSEGAGRRRGAPGTRVTFGPKRRPDDRRVRHRRLSPPAARHAGRRPRRALGRIQGRGRTGARRSSIRSRRSTLEPGELLGHDCSAAAAATAARTSASPERVREDVLARFVSFERARDVYGVAFEADVLDDSLEVDEAGDGPAERSDGMSELPASRWTARSPSSPVRAPGIGIGDRAGDVARQARRSWSSGRDEERLARLRRRRRRAPHRRRRSRCRRRAARIVAETVDSLRQRWTSLVHSAGIFWPKPFAEAPLEEFDQQCRVNVRAPYALTQAALPHLRPDGVVIFVSSIAGHVGFPNSAAYCATKGAVELMAKSLADGARAARRAGQRDRARKHPHADERGASSSRKEYERTMIERTPYGRVGVVEDVAPRRRLPGLGRRPLHPRREHPRRRRLGRAMSAPRGRRVRGRDCKAGAVILLASADGEQGPRLLAASEGRKDEEANAAWPGPLGHRRARRGRWPSASASGGRKAATILIGISAAKTGGLAPYDLQSGQLFQMRIDADQQGGRRPRQADQGASGSTRSRTSRRRRPTPRS